MQRKSGPGTAAVFGGIGGLLGGLVAHSLMVPEPWKSIVLGGIVALTVWIGVSLWASTETGNSSNGKGNGQSQR
jgi:uncharacterized membrane protein YccC